MLFGVEARDGAAQGGQDAATKLFQAAVELVLKDESFSIPYRPAIRAREHARAQIEWSSRPHCESFSAELVGSARVLCALPFCDVAERADVGELNWTMVSANWEMEEGLALLQLVIINHCSEGFA